MVAAPLGSHSPLRATAPEACPMPLWTDADHTLAELLPLLLSAGATLPGSPVSLLSVPQADADHTLADLLPLLSSAGTTLLGSLLFFPSAGGRRPHPGRGAAAAGAAG